MFAYYSKVVRGVHSFSVFGNPRYLVRKMSNSLSDSFENAKKKLNTLSQDPDITIKQKLYGLFKQATIGQCNTLRPKESDIYGKFKWEAWNSLGTLSQDDAKKEYISLVNELVSPDSADYFATNKFDGITYSVEGHVTKIVFNRPERKNAISVQMYTDIVAALKEAAENSTTVTLITGQGDYFSSGNDLSNFTSMEGDFSTLARNAAEMLKSFVAAFIDFPKLLVAAVNGPAIGIPVTLLGLFDFVYASDKATFQTPFSLLGQSPEGCSTYTFPKIMGYGKANEVLLLNKKLTAMEAMKFGLVTDVFPHAQFYQHVENILAPVQNVSKNSMIYSKQLMRDVDRDVLHKVNTAECERLVERWQSPDCLKALGDFFSRKAKL